MKRNIILGLLCVLCAFVVIKSSASASDRYVCSGATAGQTYFGDLLVDTITGGTGEFDNLYVNNDGWFGGDVEIEGGLSVGGVFKVSGTTFSFTGGNIVTYHNVRFWMNDILYFQVAPDTSCNTIWLKSKGKFMRDCSNVPSLPNNFFGVSASTAAGATAGYVGRGVMGVARTNGAADAIGVHGWATASATGNTGNIYGVKAGATVKHAGGTNYGLYTTASGGATNWPLYVEGVSRFTGAPKIGNGSTADQTIMTYFLGKGKQLDVKYYNDVLGLSALGEAYRVNAVLLDPGTWSGDSVNVARGSQSEAGSYLYSVTRSIAKDACISVGYVKDMAAFTDTALMFICREGVVGEGDITFRYLDDIVNQTNLLTFKVSGTAAYRMDAGVPFKPVVKVSSPCDGDTTTGAIFSGASGLPCYCSGSGAGLAMGAMDGTSCSY